MQTHPELTYTYRSFLEGAQVWMVCNLLYAIHDEMILVARSAGEKPCPTHLTTSQGRRTFLAVEVRRGQGALHGMGVSNAVAQNLADSLSLRIWHLDLWLTQYLSSGERLERVAG